jgi:hypothetical protein
MSVTYPADATATTYLFTLRGKVNTPTVADARELHNKTAGSADGIAAARALGDLQSLQSWGLPCFSWPWPPRPGRCPLFS